MFEKHCDRCGKETAITTCSQFNLEELCMNCKCREEAHPDYEKAVEAERKQVKAGNTDFNGIGLPDDLR